MLAEISEKEAALGIGGAKGGAAAAQTPPPGRAAATPEEGGGSAQAVLDAVWSGDAGAVSSALRTAPQAATATYATSEGLATIHAAVQRGHTEVLHVLLEAGVAPDLPKQDGATALFLAAAKGQVESMQALLSAGADAAKTLP